MVTTPRLPDGFAVQLDPRVHVDPQRRVLVGDAAPGVLARVNPAVSLLTRGRLVVCDERSAALARSLLEAGVAHPRPTSLPSHEDVTVVIGVRRDSADLDRLLRRLAGLRVIVVDDASAHPVRRAGVTVIRHDRPRGYSAARNTGLEAAATDFVAFFASDAVPERGWLELMLGHFTDPAVALVVPRVLTDTRSGGRLAGYERDCSLVDRGTHETTLRDNATVPYVSGVAMLVRRSAVRGFDESLRSAQGTELCRRLEREGWHLRYEPIARVTVAGSAGYGHWLRRNYSYGNGVGVVSARHPRHAVPLTAQPWAIGVCLLAALGGRRGLQCAALVATVETARAVAVDDDRRRDTLARNLSRQVSVAATQTVSAALRHYWPAAVLVSVVSRRARRALLVAMVADGLLDWSHRRSAEPDHPGPIGHVVLKRAEDVAFGAGLWAAMVRTRSLGALNPLR
ncbi:mycofactocin biosynthesis glycosyltransferase MftF [Speluncibacter jeojiensis]|uniref:Mycofactocin biosynthesis glycosyltransferase MftF n=1 Tax=Speluncibacter jeojiensis TaxID=2710754 RepID=A0A9X4M078_9ACTN|nr:mycofactocin biosynthesis glycosyltransferase MftF [Corynebacteriales bacterium D3-21]